MSILAQHNYAMFESTPCKWRQRDEALDGCEADIFGPSRRELCENLSMDGLSVSDADDLDGSSSSQASAAHPAVPGIAGPRAHDMAASPRCSQLQTELDIIALELSDQSVPATPDSVHGPQASSTPLPRNLDGGEVESIDSSSEDQARVQQRRGVGSGTGTGAAVARRAASGAPQGKAGPPGPEMLNWKPRQPAGRPGQQPPTRVGDKATAAAPAAGTTGSSRVRTGGLAGSVGQRQAGAESGAASLLHHGTASGAGRAAAVERLDSAPVGWSMKKAVRAAQDVGVGLSAEQQAIVRAAVVDRSNLYVHGEAGTGKTVATMASIRAHRLLYGDEAVAVTASTGVAAGLLEGGQTLHSFLGAGRTKQTADQLFRAGVASGKIHTWRKTKVLYVDEISRIDEELMNTVSGVLQLVFGNQRAFGGVQGFLTGDFCQQLPITRPGTPAARLAFQSQAWRDARLSCLLLQQVYRQGDDAQFRALLRSLRLGRCSPTEWNLLRRTEDNAVDSEGNALRATATNGEADSYNDEQLSGLPGEATVLAAEDEMGADITAEDLDQRCAVPANLCLKPGAKIMLRYNLDVAANLINGTRGVVMDDADMTQDTVPCRFCTGPRIFREVSLSRRVFEVEGANGEVIGTRRQFPIHLAYAVTVHKLQGLTVPWLVIDATNIRGIGQLYTALSRVPALCRVKIIGLVSQKMNIRADPRAVEFHEDLRRKAAGV